MADKIIQAKSVLFAGMAFTFKMKKHLYSDNVFHAFPYFPALNA